MRIKNLRIRNFTSLVDVKLSNLPNLVVLIGKNSSGKSNVIDTLARLLTEPARQLGSIEDFQHLFPNFDTQTSPPPEIAITLTLDPHEWESWIPTDAETIKELEDIEIFIAKQIINVEGLAQWTTNAVSIDGSYCVRENVITDIPAVLPVLSTDVTNQDIPTLMSIDNGLFVAQLEETLNAGFKVIHTTENPRDWGDRFSERPTIVSDEHVNALWERSQSSGSLRKRWTTSAKQYEEIAPNEQRPVGVASSIQMEEGTLSIPIGMTGEGSQAMFRLIDLLEDASQIIAIEEPETHLHPGLIKQVGKLLQDKANTGTQVFVCTHSPFLVEQSALDNVYVVKKERGETQISSIGDTEGLRNMLLYIGMRPSDILFSNAILLVEGLSDEIFFNGLSNKNKTPLVETYVKFVRAGGYPSGRHKIEFWAEVGRDAGLPLYLILDKNAQNEVEIAVGKGLVDQEQCLILQKGDLEDCYPWPLFEKAASTLFDVTIDDSISIDTRVKDLKKKLTGKKNRNEWKPLIAEEIVRTITPEHIKSEIVEIAEFVRKIHREVGG